MAEAVFRSLTRNEPRIGRIDSCGTDAYHVGDSPDPRTMSTLEDHGITDYKHAARKLQKSDFSRFDYVLVMDKSNLGDVKGRRISVIAENMGNVMLFGDYGGRVGEEVVDPYYGGRNGFEIAYEQMVRFSKGFLKEIIGAPYDVKAEDEEEDEDDMDDYDADDDDDA